MKNIHILATPQPSRLVKQKYDSIDRLCLADMATKRAEYKRFNIYITSDEKPKDGDWMIRGNEQPIKVTKDFFWDFGLRYYKIILTTDQDLIKDGVQAIPDNFLEWFVKNPNCEFAIVELPKSRDKYISNEQYQKEHIWDTNIKIIIPKEEPKQTVQEYEQQGLEKYSYELDPKQGTMSEAIKQVITNQLKQETLEEAKQRYVYDKYKQSLDDVVNNAIDFGAKWKQEQDKNKYSEEDMDNYAEYCTTHVLTSKIGHPYLSVKEWFEQVKKK